MMMVMMIMIRSMILVACIISLSTAFFVPPRTGQALVHQHLHLHLHLPTTTGTTSSTRLWESAAETSSSSSPEGSNDNNNNNNNNNSNLDPSSLPAMTPKIKLDGFDLDTALFCGGLAFDTYTEPAQNSSRWERGVR
jgi:hypothetical protein